MKPLYPLWLLLFVGIALLIFFVYATTRETIGDADSFAFIQYSCGKTPVGKDGSAIGLPLSIPIYKILPCNMLFFKAFGVLMLFLTICVLAKIGLLFDKANGWIVGLLAFANIYFIPEFLKMEEVIMAYPIIFLGFYFLFQKKYSFALITIGIAGLVWKGSVFYFILVGLYSIWASPIAIGLIVLFWKELSGTLMAGINSLSAGFAGQQVMQETMIGFGFIVQTILLIGLRGQNKWLWFGTIYTLAIATLAQKYALFAIPFLAVGVLNLLNNKKFSKEKIVNTKILIGMITVGIFIMSLISIPNIFPTNQDIHAVKEIVLLSKQGLIGNDFGFGWTIGFYGGNSIFYSGFPNANCSDWHGYILTELDCNCKKIDKKIYYCL